jgi:Cu/Ag efflux pump CusA
LYLSVPHYEEALWAILMNGLFAGLVLIPLVLASGQLGIEIQAPMGVVILGGLLSSTELFGAIVYTHVGQRAGKALVGRTGGVSCTS